MFCPFLLLTLSHCLSHSVIVEQSLERCKHLRWAGIRMTKAGGNWGADWNVIKLSSNMLLYQGVTCYATRCHEERVRLGPAFDGAGLDAVRAVGIDHQRG